MIKKLNQKGFTIIELLVVISIIGILVLLATPRFLNYINDARVSTMQADIKVLSNSATLYNIDNPDSWPVKVDDSDQIINVTISNSALKDYLVSEGIEKDESGTITAEIAKLDKDKFKKYVKTIANSYDDYFIVIDGDLAGNVFHLNGISDGDGIKQFGLNKIIK